MSKRAVVVGAGLTGATAALGLKTAGWDVTVYEAEDSVGGNLRTASLNGVRYERFGPHIWHTDNMTVHEIAEPYLREYTHRVKTVTSIGTLSWPPQVDELQDALGEQWNHVAHELANRPELPDANKASFEEYAVALMGRTLYELFIRDYTIKQWGRDPLTLSAAFAPKRIDLRDDGDTRLFRDQPQGWFDGEEYINDALADCEVHLGMKMGLKDLPEKAADAFVITAPLDEFMDMGGMLAWRGVGFHYEWVPGVNMKYETAVTNFPQPGIEYTRVTEAKHLTGSNVWGTVLAWEFSGTEDRFYPVLDSDGVNRTQQRWLRDQLKKDLPNALVAGRLGQYVYIDMDQAMQQGLNAARTILEEAK